MCLIAWNWQPDSDTPLLLLGNRDEFYARSTQALHWWDGGKVLAGKDLEAGGTWLGLTAQGRLAMLTNVRDPSRIDVQAPSRGQIVPQWLSGHEPTDRFWMRTALSGYNGFNLIAADFQRGECFWASNIDSRPKRLERGLYGLCFSAYTQGQRAGDQISQAQVRRRIELIAPHTRWVRSFACTEGHEQIPTIARDMGLKTMVGAWISRDRERNEREIAALIKALGVTGKGSFILRERATRALGLTGDPSVVPAVKITSSGVAALR